MFLSIVQMVLPVLIAFGLGTLCKRKAVFGEEGLKGLKAVVGKITLPAVLFYAFLTAEYSGRIALTFGTVFLACVLGLLAGYALRRFVKPYGKYLPFLLTEFEGGMLGYALFGLLYAGQTHIFAMIDIGQTFCTFTVFYIALKAANGEAAGLKTLVKTVLHNVVLIAMIAGALLGVLGVGKWAMATAAGPVITALFQFLAAPTSMLILLIVGYELRFDKALLSPVLKTVGLRLLVMLPLMALSALLIFAVIPFQKELFAAMLLAYTLPAPFIIPLYATDPAHKAYISTTLSIQTLVSLVLFIGVAAYTLA
ncbi:MAG TPA: hypothetical protein PKU80_02075 [Candidatus Limiplasma sp.]|nr:hypothetical protein [Candidatus Limiplasma sp.]HRX08520.1 hypothetical protein [Candidatus Limiplasma sp.]